MKTRTWLTLSLVGLLLASTPARADDVADEADVEFELGTARYQAGDYTGALEHFLASNRLAPNHNVLLDIARTYEQLGQFPNAYRYYTLAAEGTTDEPFRAKVRESLERIRSQVAVLNLQTDPPGATIFLDRKDLGARGNTPRTLGLAPGTYKIVLELPGYEPKELSSGALPKGQTMSLTIPLKRILGRVRILGTHPVDVVVDSENAAPACRAPCNLELPPGRHLLFYRQEGRQVGAGSVDVHASEETSVAPSAERLVGTLVVNTDVRDALVEVDGKSVGFTPVITSVPIGPHNVRVTLEGYKTVLTQTKVDTEAQTKIDLSLDRLELVEAASRTAESVDDAPNSVTIITREELRGMGYPTIAEALRGVRGLYVNDDSNYNTLGIRGFSRLGDYGNRVLVLLDGQPMNDNYIWSSYIGYDARVDLEDVDHIEIVRGPGSVLYGTSAFLGVINVVTRPRNTPSHSEVGTSVASGNVGRLHVGTQQSLGEHSGFWASAAGALSPGRDFYFPEYQYDTPSWIAGQSRGNDSMQAATFNGRYWNGPFTIQAFATRRGQDLPSGFAGTVVGAAGTRFDDTRLMTEARFEPQVGPTLQSLSRVHLNNYHYDGSYTYTDENGGPYRENFQGVWGGLEQRFIVTPFEGMRLTLGGEMQRHFETHQWGASESSVYIDRNDPFWVGAGYGVIDWSIFRALRISAGARLDYYSDFGSSINPRVSFIAKPYASGVWKLMFGKAFRAPSVYELYYSGAGQYPSRNLEPENIYSGELEITHHLSSSTSLIVDGFANYIENLIVLRDGDNTSANLPYFDRSKSPVAVYGSEAEIRRDWRQGTMLAANVSLQHAEYVNNLEGLRDVPNSPEVIGSLKAATPLYGKYFLITTKLSFTGPRLDRDENPTDPPQRSVNSGVVWDLVLSGEVERFSVRYQLGLYNALDYKWYVPVSSGFGPITAMPQLGRSVLASLLWRF